MSIKDLKWYGELIKSMTIPNLAGQLVGFTIIQKTPTLVSVFLIWLICLLIVFGAVFIYHLFYLYRMRKF